jgi:hypothetical protein
MIFVALSIHLHLLKVTSTGHGAAELQLGTTSETAGAQLTLSAALLRCAGMLTSGVTEDV